MQKIGIKFEFLNFLSKWQILSYAAKMDSGLLLENTKLMVFLAIL